MENQTNQIIKEKHPLVTFWNKHKKGMIITISAIGISILAIFGYKMYLDHTAFDRWFQKASLQELKEARGLTHKEFLSHTTNDEFREDLWRLISVFDKKISDLEWKGKPPCGPAYHRKHGYNLYKLD